jgi:superfamily II DNA or RNA helicase
MIKLHPYQNDVVAEFNAVVEAGQRRIIIVAPTGAGKTIIAADIIRQALSGSHRKILFIAHRDELLTQARSKLADLGIVAGIIKSGRDRDLRPLASCQVAGIQTLHARAVRAKSMELPDANIVFFDEAHHIRARTYEAILESYPDAIIIGLTATPCRGDGRGLGNVFEIMIECPQIPELIRLEYLVPVKIFAPPAPNLRGVKVAAGDYVISQLSGRMNTDALVGDFIEHWLRHAQRRRTIAFAVDVAHSRHITDELLKSDVRAEHLDGTTPQVERNAILERLRTGETEVVSNCQVLTEGFDLPDIGCIALVRPTKSLGLFRQMIGRGLRTATGKTDVIILDHSGGVHRHGRPDDVIEWTLDTDKRAANKTHDARIAKAGGGNPFCECTACGHLRMKGMACDNCGWQPKPPGRAVDYIDGQLVELGKPAIIPSEVERKIFYAELRGYQATARRKDGSPYHQGWAANQFRNKHGSFPPWSWNDHPPVSPSPATLRWIKHRQIAWAKRNSPARGAA